MRLIRITGIFLLLFIAAVSCLEPYLPTFPKEEVNTIVISGSMSDQEGYDYIFVSLATSLGHPEFFPVVGCTGYIEDSDSNMFAIENMGAGEYRFWIGKENLVPGKSYRLYLKTPGGVEYASDFENMPKSSSIDSLYYNWEVHQTDDPKMPLTGLQFYCDMKGKPEDSRYYRWTVEETYEYHSPYVIEYYFDEWTRKITNYSTPDYSKQICYKTENTPDIFIMSTNGMSSNAFQTYPLHYIPNTSMKLLYNYSVQIILSAIDEQAYKYYAELKQNSENQDGLYNKQPLQIKGNVHCLTEPNKRVLGYFCVSSRQTKRMTLSNLQNLNVNLSDYCRPWAPKEGIMNFLKTLPYDHNAYYLVHTDTGNFLADRSCFDCRLLGGVTSKPAFIP